MIEIECDYTEPSHIHEYPDDWHLGGANGVDPRVDPRWQPTTYEYYDSRTRLTHTTQTPLCDDQAIDEFTKVASWGFDPVWIGKREGRELVMLPVTYDKAQDLVVERD